jgi:hypothetical protein
MTPEDRHLDLSDAAEAAGRAECFPCFLGRHASCKYSEGKTTIRCACAIRGHLTKEEAAQLASTLREISRTEGEEHADT